MPKRFKTYRLHHIRQTISVYNTMNESPTFSTELQFTSVPDHLTANLLATIKKQKCMSRKSCGGSEGLLGASKYCVTRGLCDHKKMPTIIIQRIQQISPIKHKGISHRMKPRLVWTYEVVVFISLGCHCWKVVDNLKLQKKWSNFQLQSYWC